MPSPHRVNTDAIEILSEARTILLENQWGRGALKRTRDGITCYCVEGAVREAGVERLGMEMRSTPPPVADALGALGKCSRISANVAFVNDRVIENRDQAVAWINRAIEWLKVST